MTGSEAKWARETMEKSRIEVMECEEEIKSIKNAIKSLTMGVTAGDNRLEVSVHKVKKAASEGGDDDGGDATTDDNQPTTFKVHLSSPIEDRTITQLYDPLNPTAEEGLAKFECVETANALLTVEAYDSSKILGVSAPHDLLPLCQDMELWRKGGAKKTSTLDIAIVAETGIDDVEVVDNVKPADASVDAADGDDVEAKKDAEDVEAKKEVVDEAEESESWEDAVAEEEEKEEGAEDKEATKDEEEEATEIEAEASPEDTVEKEEEATDESATKDESEDESKPTAQEDESKTLELQLPIYTLTIQLEYTPSPDDKRDALYDKLNEVSKRKVAAIDSLRKCAGIISRAAKASEAAGGGEMTTSPGKSPAVKSGFLNNKPKASEKGPPIWKKWYEKTIGPQSMLWVVGPIAKNYVLFVGVSLFIHFKGDLLALPPPV